jgi:hypothetical protein
MMESPSSLLLLLLTPLKKRKSDVDNCTATDCIAGDIGTKRLKVRSVATDDHPLSKRIKFLDRLRLKIRAGISNNDLNKISYSFIRLKHQFAMLMREFKTCLREATADTSPGSPTAWASMVIQRCSEIIFTGKSCIVEVIRRYESLLRNVDHEVIVMFSSFNQDEVLKMKSYFIDCKRIVDRLIDRSVKVNSF